MKSPAAPVGRSPGPRRRRWAGSILPTLQAPGLSLRVWNAAGRADALAGIVVAAYLVPQCLAYARVAGLEPVTGLWAAFPGLAVYAVLGTSRVLSMGPESACAVLVASSVAALAGPGAEPAELAAALAVAVGAICLVGWLIRLGFLADLLSKPVLVGYLGGVAATMIVSQLPTLTGVSSDRRDTLGRVADVVSGLDGARVLPLVMGSTVVAALVLLQRFRRLPGPLLVVLVATVVTAVFGLEDHGIATVGRVPGGLPRPDFPSIPADVWPLVFTHAVAIAVVAFSGNILTGRAFRRHGPERIDADQELLALGGANALVGALGGFPVSSSDSRSALSLASGGSSQLTSLMAAVAVIIVLLVGGPLLESFPQAALGGLIVYAGARLMDLPEIRRVIAFRRSEAVIMTVAFVGVVLYDLLIGIAVAVALSVADLFRRIARAHDAVQGQVPGLAGLHDVDDYPQAVTVPGLVVYRYDAPLCFANAEDFRVRVLGAVAAEPEPVEWVVLNMEANVEIDLTAMIMLEELRAELSERDIVLALTRVKQDLALYLVRAGLTERIGADRVYPTLPTALEGFRHRRNARSR